MLKTLTRHIQVLESPWNAQHSRTVSPKVQHLAIRSAHQVSAGAKATVRIQILHALNQSKAGFLEKIVVFFGATLLLTPRDAVGQTQVLENLLVSLLGGMGKATPLFLAAASIQNHGIKATDFTVAFPTTKHCPPKGLFQAQRCSMMTRPVFSEWIGNQKRSRRSNKMCHILFDQRCDAGWKRWPWKLGAPRSI